MGRTYIKLNKRDRKKLKANRQKKKATRLIKAGEYGSPKRESK